MRPMESGKVYITAVHKVKREPSIFDWNQIEETGMRVALAIWNEKKDLRERCYQAKGREWLNRSRITSGTQESF